MLTFLKKLFRIKSDPKFVYWVEASNEDGYKGKVKKGLVVGETVDTTFVGPKCIKLRFIKVAPAYGGATIRVPECSLYPDAVTLSASFKNSPMELEWT